MKKVLLIAIAAALILCGCAAPAQTPAEPTPAQAVESKPEAVPAPEPETEPVPAFDLDAYKSAVDQFRRDVVDCTINLSKLAAYEVAYMNASKKVTGTTESDKTLEYAFEKVDEELGIAASDFDAANDKVRSEYADIITMEIEGKEAEELDTYVRAMYESFSNLYKAVKTTSSSGYDSFVSCIADTISGVSSANDNISLFCGDYGG